MESGQEGALKFRSLRHWKNTLTSKKQLPLFIRLALLWLSYADSNRPFFFSPSPSPPRPRIIRWRDQKKKVVTGGVTLKSAPVQTMWDRDEARKTLKIKQVQRYIPSEDSFFLLVSVTKNLLQQLIIHVPTKHECLNCACQNPCFPRSSSETVTDRKHRQYPSEIGIPPY